MDCHRIMWMAAGLVSVWLLSAGATAQEVDLALALAIDTSYSVDAREHQLQMTGMAYALSSHEVLEALKAGEKKKIAITVYEWASEYSQAVVIPWTVIDGPASAAKVSDALARGPRLVKGGTGISNALLYGGDLMRKAPAATRKVLDLSTDGSNNMGGPVKPASRSLVAQGITVNGLAISNEINGLGTYLENNLIGGPASFVEETLDYDHFKEAMQRKLLREIYGLRMSANNPKQLRPR